MSDGFRTASVYVRGSFAVGNSDLHLKNFSLIETEAQSGRYVLSRAYDLLPMPFKLWMRFFQ